MRIRSSWKFISWSLIILMLSGFPGKALTELFTWDRLFSFDKLAHAIIYFVQFLLLFPLLSADNTQRSTLANAIIAFIVTVAFGALMELMQATVFSDRSGDLLDIIANSAGSLFALIYILARKGARNKKQAIH